MPKPRLYSEEEAAERKRVSSRRSYEKNFEKYRQVYRSKRAITHPDSKTRKPKPNMNVESHQCNYIYPGTPLQCSRKVIGEEVKNCWQHNPKVKILKVDDVSSEEK